MDATLYLKVHITACLHFRSNIQYSLKGYSEFNTYQKLFVVDASDVSQALDTGQQDQYTIHSIGNRAVISATLVTSQIPT